MATIFYGGKAHGRKYAVNDQLKTVKVDGDLYKRQTFIAGGRTIEAFVHCQVQNVDLCDLARLTR